MAFCVNCEDKPLPPCNLCKTHMLELLLEDSKGDSMEKANASSGDRPANKGDLLPDKPKPWKTAKPKGLFELQGPAISKETHDELWEFFHPKGEEFPWKARFNRFGNAHPNHWSTGQFPKEDGQLEFQERFPSIYKAAFEALESAKREISIEKCPLLHSFQPEFVSIMRHHPNWGLGSHVDNVRKNGIVLLLSISNGDDRVPRKFKFSCPPLGITYVCDTWNCSLIVFTDEAYEIWAHESIRNPKQTSECISLTIRQIEVNRQKNQIGPTYAMWNACKRIREIYPELL